jgi:hypothetical protein
MGRFVSVGQNLSGGDKTTLYTVPTRNNAYWSLFYAINNGSNNKTVSLFWYDKSADVEIEILNGYTLNAKEYLKFDGGAIIALDQGDEIRVQQASDADISVMITFELIPEIGVKNNY